MKNFLIALLLLWAGAIVYNKMNPKDAQLPDMPEACRIEATRACSDLADRGNAAAQYAVGSAYLKGQDRRTACVWLTRSADQQYAAARKLLDKSGYTSAELEDCQKALKYGAALYLYEAEAEAVEAKAAEASERGDCDTVNSCLEPAQKGKLLSQKNLAKLHLYGKGENYNPEEAFKWFKKAAEQGDAESQSYLGLLYTGGIGTAVNVSEGFKWYSKATTEKDCPPVAYYGLGLLYLNSDDPAVPRNADKALYYIRAAAEAGLAEAQGSLGMFYAKGQGVEMNEKTAVEWFLKGAAGGDARSQYTLGEMYSKGFHSISKNRAEGCYWYYLGMLNGDEKAKKNFEERFTPEEQSAAKKRYTAK